MNNIGCNNTLHTVTNAVNLLHRKVEYVSDRRNFGGDYHQTVEMTLANGSGDCEDIAVVLSDYLNKLHITNRIVKGLYNGRYHIWNEAYCLTLKQLYIIEMSVPTGTQPRIYVAENNAEFDSPFNYAYRTILREYVPKGYFVYDGTNFEQYTSWLKEGI